MESDSRFRLKFDFSVGFNDNILFVWLFVFKLKIMLDQGLKLQIWLETDLEKSVARAIMYQHHLCHNRPVHG